MAVAYTARASRTASWSAPRSAWVSILLENVAMRAYVAYDYQFRQPDWDEGILWGGLNFGVRF